MADLDQVVTAASRLLSPAAPGVIALVTRRSPELEALRKALHVDPVLTVKVINHANHSFYARQVPVADLRRALVRLGWETSRELLLRLVVEAAAQESAGAAGTAVWTSATRVAVLSRLLARPTPLVDDGLAFTAGLVHNLGQLGLLAIHRQGYASVLTGARSGAHLARTERERFGYDHARVGAGVLEGLSVPEELPRAVRRQYRANLHSRPWDDDPSLAVAAVLQLAHIGLYDDGARLGDVDWMTSQPLVRRLGLSDEDLTDLPARLEAGVARALGREPAEAAA